MANELQTAQKPMTLGQIRDLYFGEIDVALRDKMKSGLVLQKNYIPYNALEAAKLAIMMTLDKDKRPALSVCSKESVKRAVLQMLQDGLNPAKKQGYFIVFGDALTWLTSYFGEACKAKYADPSIRDIFAEVVYEGDKFAYKIVHGYKIITLHEQAPENVNNEKIKGAYATILYQDGTEKSDYMTKAQILNSWSRGQTHGQSDAHKLAPEEMSKKTVLRRLCKLVYNTSDDSEIVQDEAEEIDREIDEKQNQQVIDVTPPEASTPADIVTDEDGVIQEPIKAKDPNQPVEFPT